MFETTLKEHYSKEFRNIENVIPKSEKIFIDFEKKLKKHIHTTFGAEVKQNCETMIQNAKSLSIKMCTW